MAGVQEGTVSPIFYIHEIDPGSPLAGTPLEVGDYIIEVNNIPVTETLNLSDIINPNEMDEVELGLLVQLTDVVLNEITNEQIISAVDLSEWHRRWLGNVYDWAGHYRSVNMGKAEFHFAAAHLIPNLMKTFEKKFLSVYMPWTI